MRRLHGIDAEVALQWTSFKGICLKICIAAWRRLALIKNFLGFTVLDASLAAIAAYKSERAGACVAICNYKWV